MEDVAQQLDDNRREIAQLLSAYPDAPVDQKRTILDRCERLGGEVQELVGVLKLSIRRIVAATQAVEGDETPECAHLQQLAGYGLRVAHCAGEEVSAAVRLIRRLRTCRSGGDPHP